jgi:hypothetical protein
LFAIQGYQFSLCYPSHRLHPTNKGAAELLWVEHGKDAAKGIMGRYPFLQVQKVTQPFKLGLAEVLDSHPIVGAT